MAAREQDEESTQEELFGAYKRGNLEEILIYIRRFKQGKIKLLGRLFDQAVQTGNLLGAALLLSKLGVRSKDDSNPQRLVEREESEASDRLVCRAIVNSPATATAQLLLDWDLLSPARREALLLQLASDGRPYAGGFSFSHPEIHSHHPLAACPYRFTAAGSASHAWRCAACHGEFPHLPAEHADWSSTWGPPRRFCCLRCDEVVSFCERCVSTVGGQVATALVRATLSQSLLWFSTILIHLYRIGTRDPKVIDLLVQEHPVVAREGKEKQTLLSLAARQNNLPILTRLVVSIGPLDLSSNTSPLLLAAEAQAIECLMLLLGHQDAYDLVVDGPHLQAYLQGTPHASLLYLLQHLGFKVNPPPNFKDHEHLLRFSDQAELYYREHQWLCNQCMREHAPREPIWHCEPCNFDVCIDCFNQREDLSDPTLVECDVCFAHKAPFSSCGQCRVCRTCVIRSIRSALLNGIQSFPLTCQLCHQPLLQAGRETELQALLQAPCIDTLPLGLGEIQQSDHFSTLAFLHQESHSSCPFCGGLISPPIPVCPKNRQTPCPYCQNLFCDFCLNKSHEGPCEELLSTIAKKCPKPGCDRKYVHFFQDGCHIMRCTRPNCPADNRDEWCYLCLTRTTNHRCPNGCPLYCTPACDCPKQL